MGNSISTLGTLHDIFLTNPNYGLKEFTSALYQFEPDLIFSEVLTDHPSAEDAAIDGGIEQSIVFAYASKYSIPVRATDWFDNDFIKEMEAENEKMTPALIANLETMSEYRKKFDTGSLLELSSEVTQNHARKIYDSLEMNGLFASRKRNNKILENIKKELSSLNDKKILIVYGMDHKFFIDDNLSNLTNAKVVKVESWFKPEISEAFKMDDSLKEQSILNLKKSASLIKSRLESNYYPIELELRLKNKERRFEGWISSVSQL